MKSIHTIGLTTLIFLFNLQAFSQSIVVKGGFNYSIISERDTFANYTTENAFIPGFHVGVSYEQELEETFAVEGGVILSTKGFQFSHEGSAFNTNTKTELFYIDVPVNFKTYVNLNRDTRIFASVGGYAGYGFRGEVNGTLTYEGESTSNSAKIDWGFNREQHDLIPIDYGFKFGAGIEFHSAILSLEYDMGTANIATYRLHQYEVNNHVLKVSLGYRFGRSGSRVFSSQLRPMRNTGMSSL